jgi:L-2-hydroxyglutarate oxidase LhgO
MDSVDCVVVGAGVIGLAIARELAQRGYETLVIEAQRHIGTGESSRNSEVIHAGIYYPRDSLKAKFCVAGREALYAYCVARGIDHRRCGKLIVATTGAQSDQLANLRTLGAAAGVDELRLLTASEAQRLEPELHCVAALESPSTGILDSHAYMLALQGDAERAGATFAFGAPVARISSGIRSVELTFVGEAAPSLQARVLVNSAGLSAQALALSMPELPRHCVPPLFYAKGNYFSTASRSPFTRLIYPLPQSGGLGIHLTLDVQGRARFGPDVEWIDTPEYNVDPSRSAAFYAAIRTYWPGLREGHLQPAYAGVRAKLGGPGAAAADFVISGPAEHGISGLINLFGIESPGLTSSLAIAAHVVRLTQERF